MLINGQWAKDFHPVQGTDTEGGFVRDQSRFRNWITADGTPGPTGEGGFSAEPDRYHLYVALICPWASRTLMVRKLKGLENIISVTVLDPRLTEKVWRFGGNKEDTPGSQSDPLYGTEYLYELYQRAMPDYTGQITVPVLWDKHRETIVNNESSDIVRMLNNGFGRLAERSIDLYPVDLRAEIDTVNERLYDSFNNGVYRAGFATTQRAYDRAVQEVFDSLEWIDRQLDHHNYLVGDRLTETDVGENRDTAHLII
ncbi:glutathione S-transferase C-terminal domain-containing protein [Vibrio sp.]|uniref:glutathione S-transferase C-terminal domain-containing protein n=1 Tax=Vibrio sp. TaxID=678 RepID=UPI003D0BD3AB